MAFVSTLEHLKSICNCKAIVQRKVRSFKNDDTVQEAHVRFLSLCFVLGILTAPLETQREGFFLYPIAEW